MAKSLDYYLNKTKAEAATASASPVQKTETNKKDLTYYLNKSKPTYSSVLGQQKGLYAQAVEDNRNAKFGEKLRGIAGGSLRGAAQTYAADLENAWATLDQTLAEINERNPFAKRLSAEAQSARTLEIDQQRRDAEAMQEQSDELSKKGSNNLEAAKSYTGRVGDLLIDTGVAVGQMGADALATALIPGAGTALMASRVYGGNARTAREEGANLLQQNLYGLGGAAAAVGIGKLAGGAMGAYGGGATDDFIEALAGKASGKAGKNIIRAVLKSQGEGIEEGLEALLDPALKAIYKGNLGQNYRDMDWQEVLQNYLVGVLSGGAAEAVSMTTGSYSAANAILEDPEVQQAVETYWRKEAENGALNKETREAFRQAASDMETAREIMAIARAAGIDTEAARALVEAKKDRDTETKKEAQKAAQPATAAEIGGINEEVVSDAGQGNGIDGIGAGEQAGVFSEAAGETAAVERGDQSETGRGRENPESADLREVRPEELGITGAQNSVMLIDPERAGRNISDAADTVRSVGMEPVAFRGELRVRNASVNGYIEDGRIFFRTDAVDSQGRAITAEQIVEHELFHAAAETDPQLVEDVKETVRERMTEAEFDTMMADYETAYSKVQDFSEWTAEQIAEYIYQEIAADAYAGINYFNNAPATVEAARAAAPQVGQAQTDKSRVETRGPPMGRAQTFVGYDDETGRGIYQSNFPEGTPKSEKGKHIIELIQKVWSKNPIELIVKNKDGTTRIIRAQFDPTYDETKNIYTDATKIAGGNRHGTAKDQRVTLNLADDYYQILSEAQYSRSKKETGKEAGPHQGVKEWHYFINEIFYIEVPGAEKVPYTVSIDVKEKDDGSFVYSYHAEINKEQTAPQTLHAAVNSSGKGAANDLLNKTVPQTEAESKENLPRASVEVNPNPWREAERFSENWAAERARDEEIQELMEADPVGVLQEGIRITKAQLGAAQGDRAKKLQNRLARLEQAEAYYAYAAETGKQVSTTENTQRVRDLRWAAEHIVDGRRKRRERSKGPDDDAPKAEYTRGEWEAEQDRRSSYETEEAPPERESVYDEEAQAFADEWARERLEQQRESEYEEAVDQAKERVLSGKKGHMTGRDGVKKTVSIRQNNRGQWFGEIKTGKSTQDTRRYKTKEEAAEAVISKAETGDETGVNSSIPENPVNKEPRTVEETRRETDERVREKAEEVLGEDPVVNGREMSPLEEKEVKDMISEHGDMLDDDAEASAELAWATEIVSGKGGNYADTLGRNLDAAAGKNKALREKLHQLIEIPLRKAKESYAKGLGGKRNALYDEIVEGLGIKPGSKESAAVQWYGEGQRNTESGDRSVLEVGGRKISVANKVAVEYTLEDLKRDFPNKWKDIVKAEQWFRRQYDEYVERINVSLEKVYPKVEEKARVELAKLKANAQYNAEQAKASEETVQQLEWKIGKERSKRSGGKKGKLLRWEKKLAEAKKAAERYREKQTRCQDAAVKLQKDIDSGEILRNKRLTPRKDYFHHMQESREGWGRLIDILTAPENISSDLSGQSEFTKPNAKFAGFMQRRTGDLAKQDAVEGFLHYIEAAEYKIAFDPFVAEGRRQIKSMAEQTANTRNANKFLVWYTDYLNGIAGKTNPFDRWMSKAFDRKSVEALKWLNSRVKANAIMGNVRSALAQFFNLQNGALYMPNPAHWARGAKLLAEQIVGKSDAKMLFDRSVFLNERFLDNKMWRFDESIMKNPNRFANWMMSAGDELSAKLIWATAYEKAAAAKMTDPIEYADDITMRSVGGRGVGDVPLTQSSEVVKLIAPFQLEVNNSWQAMKENFKAKNGAGFVAMAVVSFAMNEALRQTLGYDVSFDMINALIEGIKGWDDEEEKWDNLMNVFGRLTGEIVSNIPMGAQIAQLLWSDEASRERFLGDADPTRFGTGNIGLDMVTSVVTEMVAGNNFADDLLSATLNLVLPWGGKQTEKIVEALQDFGVLPRVSASMRDGISVDKQAEPGSYSQSGRLRFPIEATAGNVMRDLLFGPYSTKQGIEFSESGEFALSEDLTTAWEALTELGMDGVEAYDAIRESRGFTADKDETGKSIAGSKKNKVLEYINGLNITEEQKDILLASAGYDEEKTAEDAPWNNAMENDEFRVWADLTTWEQEDYEEFVEGAGMSLNDYAAFCEATRDMTADKDENGKSISGTKKKKIVDYIQSLDIPAEQKDALFFAAGYKESTLDETPWHDGEETEEKKKKSGGRGGRRRSGREKALSIKSIAEDLGLEDAIRGVSSPGNSAEYASAYADIQKVTDRLQEKNPWYALPTGNPELDEERPAAARYFKTGKL